jgi:phosphate-selective porin
MKRYILSVRFPAVRSAALVCALAGYAPAAEAQEATTERSIFVMEDRPSIRFGDVLRLDATTKLDASVWHSDLNREGTEFSVDRRRVGVEGRLFRIVGFEIEGDLGDRDQPWRDVFAELRKWRAVRVKGGRFKIPFGQERLTSIAELDFINRSLASEALTPGRDTGVQVHGRIGDGILTYMAGAFEHDGDVSRKGTDEPGDRTGAFTMTVAPFAKAGTSPLEHLEFGIAATVGDVPEGLNGLRARSVGGYEAIAPHFVSGRRVRMGAHAGWVNGRIGIRGEFLEVRDERKGQGLGGEDLPNVIGRGSYVSGTWFLVGALKGSAPKRGLNAGGPGAIQIGARTEWLSFSSAGAFGEPFRNQRAPNILRNDLRSSTLGVNWFPIRFVKLQFNLVREQFGDRERHPDPARAAVFSRVFSIQFAL